MKYIGDILYDEDLLLENKKLIIFGGGICGKKILRYLDMNGVKSHIICFCDSDKRLQGQDIEGIPIWHIEGVCKHYRDADYLIGGKYVKEMYQTLRDKYVENIHILFL